MTQLRAIYSDIHGCYHELVKLYSRISKKYPGIEHWHVGDLVDRGSYSGEVIDFVMKNFTGGVMGNHEDTMIGIVLRNRQYGYVPKNLEKVQTMKQITDRRLKYIQSLPRIHVFDDVGLIIVHGGLVPKVPLYAQNPGLCIRAQMILPNRQEMHNRWWGCDSIKQRGVHKTEKESYEEGYRRWYEVYDFEYDCIFGHSVMGLKPFVHQREGFGKTIGIDTGSCFGGNLTAYIYPEMKYEQIKCSHYAEGKNVRQMRKDEERIHIKETDET